MTPLPVAGAAAVLLAVTTAGCGSTTAEPRTSLTEQEARFYMANHGNLQAADALLTERVSSALKSDPLTQASNIQVTVTQGRARLTGFVHNAAAKHRAVDLVQRTDGVVAVENRLILRYHAGLAVDPLGDARVRL